ncbi:hypothetical protein AQUCO_02200092v1 [Aquilegia coerulea]|uniref:Uncharacterized protein n=1 Tax=Aquilegia coerulea TaxID=218851 RepID=A0A2G5DD32_AQUCA|nr:hypothetical protein AQUCO_02200092v1 [Aquilegia coerulea]
MKKETFHGILVSSNTFYMRETKTLLFINRLESSIYVWSRIKYATISPCSHFVKSLWRYLDILTLGRKSLT